MASAAPKAGGVWRPKFEVATWMAGVIVPRGPLPQLPLFLSTREVAEIIGVSVEEVRHLIHTGKLQGFRIAGGNLRISRESLLEAITPVDPQDKLDEEDKG